MPVARTGLNLKRHFNQILRDWAGKECTHVIITEKMDQMGQIIGQTRSLLTIYGIIGDASFKDNNYPIGSLQPGDLCAMFKYEDDVRLSDQLTDLTTRQDHIIFQNIEYRIENVEYAYDVLIPKVDHEPIFGKYLLKRITI